jgi:hypothetical protein
MILKIVILLLLSLISGALPYLICRLDNRSPNKYGLRAYLEIKKLLSNNEIRNPKAKMLAKFYLFFSYIFLLYVIYLILFIIFD